MRCLRNAPAVIVVALSLLAQTSRPPGKPDGHPAFSCIVGGRVVTAVKSKRQANRILVSTAVVW
jgi:hypothetical protein